MTSQHVDELLAELRELRQVVAQQAHAIAALSHGTAPATSPHTLAALWAAFERLRLPRLRPSSQNAYRTSMAPVLRALRARIAADLTLADLDEYVASRRGSHTRFGRVVSPTTLAHEVKVLAIVLNWATSRKLITANPLKGYQCDRIESRREKVFSEAEIERLLEHCDRPPRPAWGGTKWPTVAKHGAELRAVILMMADAGLRPGEILNLERAQVDERTGLVSLRGEQTKNHRARTTCLSPRALDAVRALPSWKRRARLLFGSPGQDRPYTYASLATWWHELCDYAGVSGDLYGLRHRAITRAIERGVPLPVVAAMVGHRDYKQIEAHYFHLDPGELRRASAALAAPAARTEAEEVPHA